MNDIEKHFALISLYTMLSSQNLMNRMIINLFSENQKNIDWAYKSLKDWNDLLLKQTTDGTYQQTYDLIYKFLKQLSEPQVAEQIVVGFSMN